MVVNLASYAILPWGPVFLVFNDVPDFWGSEFPVVCRVDWLLGVGPDVFMVFNVVSYVVSWGEGFHHLA